METTPKTIRWGIIGLGKIAHKFATDLATVPNAQLYAVASRTQEKAEEFAQMHNAEKAYDSYEALANDSMLDAVYIATPHVYHKENTIMCLKNGIAVLCEKPFAMNLQEVEDMIATAQATNTLLMEALWTAFLPHYQYVQQLLREKVYGDILTLEADFGFKPKYDPSSRVIAKNLGGGSLLDIGLYPIFAALSTLGKPNNITAEAEFFEGGADASCNMVFEYNKQVKAYLKSTLVEDTATQAIFHCEKGSIKLHTKFHQPTIVELIPYDGPSELKDFDYTTIGYNFETLHFNDLIRNGKKESDIMTFNFSRTLINTLDTVRTLIGLEYQ